MVSGYAANMTSRKLHIFRGSEIFVEYFMSRVLSSTFPNGYFSA
jgi:hypothetical protein